MIGGQNVKTGSLGLVGFLVVYLKTSMVAATTADEIIVKSIGE